MYTGAAQRGLGDTLDTVAADTTGAYAGDPPLAQLHQLTLLIVQLRQEFNDQLNLASNADATFDPNVLTGLAQEMQQYVAQFRALRAAIDRTTINQNALNGFDQAILDVGTWAQQTVAVLPTAMAALPNALIDALGNIATNTGQNIVKSIALPALVIAGALVAGLAFVTRAERTRTGRALVRRL